MNIKYFERVSVTLFNHLAKRMRLITLSSFALAYFSTLRVCHKRHDFNGKSD